MRHILNLALISITLAAGPVFAQSSGEQSEARQRMSDFTLNPVLDCAQQRVMPEWFTEGEEAIPTRWRSTMRDRYYQLKRLEHALNEGKCDCDSRFPDPTQWKDDFDELIALYSDEKGLKVRPEYDPDNPLTHNLIRPRTELTKLLVAQCSE